MSYLSFSSLTFSSTLATVFVFPLKSILREALCKNCRQLVSVISCSRANQVCKNTCCAKVEHTKWTSQRKYTNKYVLTIHMR